MLMLRGWPFKGLNSCVQCYDSLSQISEFSSSTTYFLKQNNVPKKFLKNKLADKKVNKFYRDVGVRRELSKLDVDTDDPAFHHEYIRSDVDFDMLAEESKPKLKKLQDDVLSDAPIGDDEDHQRSMKSTSNQFGYEVKGLALMFPFPHYKVPHAFFHTEAFYLHSEEIAGPTPEQLKKIIVAKKVFPQPVAPNLLTVVERETIRFLHSKDPKEWTVEKLAESFPVDERGVKGILRSRPPRTLRSILLQDKEVCENWKLLSKGQLELEPELKNHLKAFHRNPRPLDLTLGDQSKIHETIRDRITSGTRPKLVAEPGEFTNIILDYQRRSQLAKQGHKVYGSKKNATTTPLMDKKSADLYGNGGETANEMAGLFGGGEMLKDSPPLGASTPYGETALMDFNINFSGDKNMDVERFREVYLKRINPVLDQSRSKTNIPQLMEESPRSKAAKAYSEWMQQRNEQSSMVTKNISKVDADEILKSEIPNEPEKRATSIPPELEVGVADVRLEEDNKTGEQELYVISSEGKGQALSVKASPDQIKIPEHLQYRYSLFQYEDSVYDSDGEFLYRIPGFKKD